MTADRRRRTQVLIRWGALLLGVVLFSGTLYYINFRVAFGTIRQLGYALPLALLFSGLWHLSRTWAWAWCFPQPRTVSFARLARVRLAAEAFSYLTLRGIAGEPLKVVLLGDRVDPRQATAAVALERIAYLVGTTIIVGIGSRACHGRAAVVAGVVPCVPGIRDCRCRHFALHAGSSSPDAARTSSRYWSASTRCSARPLPPDASRASSPRSSGRCWSCCAATRCASPC